eukprot:1161286-Pelagomonas_calceolata.AAC.9
MDMLDTLTCNVSPQHKGNGHCHGDRDEPEGRLKKNDMLVPMQTHMSQKSVFKPCIQACASNTYAYALPAPSFTPGHSRGCQIASDVDCNGAQEEHEHEGVTVCGQNIQALSSKDRHCSEDGSIGGRVWPLGLTNLRAYCK